VTVIAKTLGNCAAELRVAAGDQHLHCHDLLVFNVEPKPGDAWNLSVLGHRSPSMLLDSSSKGKLRMPRRADNFR
jgi:hypothetical protein